MINKDSIMYESLTAINLAPGELELPGHLKNQIFEMKTCQRTLLVGIGIWPLEILHFLKDRNDLQPASYAGVEAYRFILEIVTGLKSRLLGESEISAQFKKAYDDYRSSPGFNSVKGQLFEKMMKDAKEIRTKYLQGLGQYSYAGVTKRVLQKYPLKNGPVLILGTGQMAHDAAKLISKQHIVAFSGRNQEKLTHLTNAFNNGKIENTWPLNFQNAEGLEKYSANINTIGADQVLYGPKYFDEWHAMSEPTIIRPFID
jgi:glutamyl-tRNA reductase